MIAISTPTLVTFIFGVVAIAMVVWIIKDWPQSPNESLASVGTPPDVARPTASIPHDADLCTIVIEYQQEGDSVWRATAWEPMTIPDAREHLRVARRNPYATHKFRAVVNGEVSDL